jgi:hypothetical protein
MTGRRSEGSTARPTRYVGVYHVGKRWQAYVMGRDDLVPLGDYATARAAVAARAEYWRTHRGGRPAHARRR